MVHTPKSTTFADNHPLNVMADPNAQVDGLERLAELAKNASPEERARLESTIDTIIRSRQLRSMTRKTVQQVEEKLTSTDQGILLTELHSMDEERRSLAELHILKGRTRK
jgi:hypothetical protein